MKLQSLALALACLPACAFADDLGQEIERGAERPGPSLAWSFSVGAETSATSFGRNVEQEITYYPVAVGVTTGGLSLAVESGYLDGTLRANGLGVREVTLPSINGRPPRVVRLPAATRIERSTSGPADTVISARYDFLPIADLASFAVAGDVKLPTADETEGLGSGEVDYSASVEFGAVTPVAPYVGVGVDVLGEPEGVTYDPAPFAYAGLDASLTDRLLLSAVVDYSQSAVDGLDDYAAASLALRVRLTDGVRLSFTGLAGLSDAAPDQSFGIRLTFRGG